MSQVQGDNKVKYCNIHFVTLLRRKDFKLLNYYVDC